MRIVIAAFVALFLGFLGPDEGVCQRVDPQPRSLQRLQERIQFPVEDTREPPSLRRRLISGLAVGVIGAGLGYFTSQVAESDWDEGKQKPIRRSSWAAVGGAGGFALGFSIPFGNPSGLGARDGPIQSGRFVITREEIVDATLNTAMEAVQHFHPEWLVERGRGTFRSLEADPLRVYLDATQLGGTESLNQIQAIEIEYIRFFDTREATLKWGTGHGHGAILVVTVRREG